MVIFDVWLRYATLLLMFYVFSCTINTCVDMLDEYCYIDVGLKHMGIGLKRACLKFLRSKTEVWLPYAPYINGSNGQYLNDRMGNPTYTSK